MMMWRLRAVGRSEDPPAKSALCQRLTRTSQLFNNLERSTLQSQDVTVTGVDLDVKALGQHLTNWTGFCRPLQNERNRCQRFLDRP